LDLAVEEQAGVLVVLHIQGWLGTDKIGRRVRMRRLDDQREYGGFGQKTT
jgi:hypothetical protein